MADDEFAELAKTLEEANKFSEWAIKTVLKEIREEHPLIIECEKKLARS
jgi:prophage antirepressor-like protein